LIYLLVNWKYFENHPIRAAFTWSFIILVSPVLLGLVFGKLSQTSTIRSVLKRFGIFMLHPVPTAWDYFFSTTKPVWALVTLTDGTKVAGYLGRESFVSSDGKERDIYLESMFRIAENEVGPWQAIPDNAGVWLAGGSIRHIEFRKGDADE
jgi:hypothetical protein